MSATDNRPADDAAEPEPLVSLDLRSLRAHIVDDEGDLVVILHDDDIAIELRSGLRGAWNEAIRNAEHGAAILMMYAETMKVRRGDRRPINEQWWAGQKPAPRTFPPVNHSVPGGI